MRSSLGWSPIGDRGVLLFFVISGYVLARPFLRQYRLAASLSRSELTACAA